MKASTNGNPKTRHEPKLPKYPAVTVTLRLSSEQLEELITTTSFREAFNDLVSRRRSRSRKA